MKSHPEYYVPHQSQWPIIAATGLFFTLGGLALALTSLEQQQDSRVGFGSFIAGLLILVAMFVGWFSNVINESRKGLYSPQLAISFRRGMSWFIFSEFMFFAAFFGALFYVRMLVVPWLGGNGDKGLSHTLWPDFVAQWPLLISPDPESYPSPKGIIDPWHIPFLNTILLVSSSFTLTLAHHALKKNNRTLTKLFMCMTLGLGLTFLGFQIFEYGEAYTELKLTLGSGIYASTFFLLTGFHGAHVTIGSIILLVIFIRIVKGHFSKQQHFGFEAAAWYWHFVDVIWLLLFVIVYII